MPDQSLAYGAERAWASVDGGRTWKAASDQSGQQSLNAFLSVQRDGTLTQIRHVLKQAGAATPTPAGIPTTTPAPPTNPGGGNAQGRFEFTSWRPGQGDWRQIAQPITGVTDIAYTVESVSQNGARALWTVAQLGGVNYDATYSVRMAQLA